MACVRGEHFKALKRFQWAVELMELVVLEGYPTYNEGVLMYRACANLVGYFLQRENYRRAADFVNCVGLVAQRLVKLNPEEPDFWRLWADALLNNAIVHAENANRQRATLELRQSVESWQRLYTALQTKEHLIDARKAFATALDLAGRWGVESEIPLEQWRQELDPDGAIEQAVLKVKGEASKNPVWLEPADPEGWPTVPFESPLLRYSLRIPKRWSSTPKIKSVHTETSHVFSGPWPTEWLIVSFMDKATAGSQMTDWVDPIIAMIGVPIPELKTSSGPQPNLIEWIYEGTSDVVAKTLDVDEAHLYSGIAQLSAGGSRLARIYILLARRGTFAWKVALSFETACLPGMPADMVASNDHVRAGAVLGELRLG